MQNKIIVKEVFKSTSSEEINRYLKDKILKLMIRQYQAEARASYILPLLSTQSSRSKQ